MKQYDRTTRSNGTASTQLQAIEGEMIENGHPVLTSDNGKQLAGGNSRAGEIIEIMDGGTRIGIATTDSDGKWTLPNVALTSGNHSLTAVHAGETSEAYKFRTASPSHGQQDFGGAYINSHILFRSGLTIKTQPIDGSQPAFSWFWNDNFQFQSNVIFTLIFNGTCRSVDLDFKGITAYTPITVTYLDEKDEPIQTDQLNIAAYPAITHAELSSPSGTLISSLEFKFLQPKLGTELIRVSWNS